MRVAAKGAIWGGLFIIWAQIAVQGLLAIHDALGPADARGWVPSEHVFAFLALCVANLFIMYGLGLSR